MTTPNPASADGNNSNKRRPFLKGLLTGGLLGTLVAGGVGAFAHHDGHPPFGKSGHGQRHASSDPGVIRERADFMVERTLSHVDATEEQRTQVKSVVEAAINDLLPLREQHQSNRKEMLAALMEPTVDRAELDRIRSAEVALVEQASQRVVTALADAVEVLTPEQRIQLADMAKRRSGHRHHP